MKKVFLRIKSYKTLALVVTLVRNTQFIAGTFYIYFYDISQWRTGIVRTGSGPGGWWGGIRLVMQLQGQLISRL